MDTPAELASLTPAETVVQAFGGSRRLAALLGRNASSVYRWTYGPGHVPAKLHSRLLELAREQRVRLTAHDLVVGRRQKICK